MMQNHFVVCGLVLIGLVACGGQDPATSPASQPARAVESAGTIRAGSSKGMLKATPMTLASCQPAVVSVSWDISALAPGLNDVEVYAGDALFASGGSTGSSPTGPWAQPGSRFTLKGVPGGEELDVLVLGGPACPQ